MSIIECLQKITKQEMVKILTYCKAKFSHSNQELLDNLSEDGDGNILYKGNAINQSQVEAVTTQNELLKSEIAELNALLDAVNRE